MIEGPHIRGSSPVARRWIASIAFASSRRRVSGSAAMKSATAISVALVLISAFPMSLLLGFGSVHQQARGGAEANERGAEEGQGDDPQSHPGDAFGAGDADRRGHREAGADHQHAEQQAQMGY